MWSPIADLPHRLEPAVLLKRDMFEVKVRQRPVSADFYLVSLSLHRDLATVSALDDTFDVQLLGIRDKAGRPGVKRPVLGLHPLPLRLAKKNGCWPELGHLSIAAHVAT